MASLKKFNGSTWDNAKARKLTTATDTITTLPADLYADGTNATVGLKGNMSQTGTPTPTTPIQPSECGERTGNLFDKTTAVLGERVYVDKVGADAGWAHSDYIDIDGLSYITVSKRADITTFYFYENKTASCTSYYQGVTAKVPEGAKYVRINMAVDDVDSNMLVSGSTAPSSFIPYGYKLPILNNSQTTNVYLGEVESTRRIKKLVLTGDEDWQRTANEKCYYINLANGCPADYLKSNIITVICSHYVGQKNTSSGSNEVNEGCVCFFTGGGYELYIGERTITSATDFKAYLAAQYAAGTPVTIWYVLSSATTTTLNEPLRKIGNYADEVSGITIPTTTGKDSFDVLTTLKPSEVELNYTGWHDATVGEWDGSDWQ